MPLLPTPRRLKRGTVWCGQSKFSDLAGRGGWRAYSTHCAGERTAREVVAVVEAYCGTWERARALLEQLAGMNGDAAVAAFLAWIRGEVGHGHDPFTASVAAWTLTDMLATFETDRKPFIAAATMRAYRDTVRLAIRAVGPIPAAQFGQSELKRFRAEISHMRPHSQNHYLTHLRGFLNWLAGREGFGGYKPPKVKLVRAPGTEHPDYYTVAECRSILAAANGRTINGVLFVAFLEFLLLTGSRLGETCALRWDWIRGNVAYLPACVTKTNRSRAVPLNSRLVAVLSGLPRISDRVFPYSAESGYLREVWREIVTAAGVRYLKIHNLRDTFIVHSILAGVPLRVIAAMVGNSAAVIERNYSALAAEEIASAMQKTEGFVSSLTPDPVQVKQLQKR